MGRYPADVAPFLAVPHAGAPVLSAGDTALLVEDFGVIVEMICEQPVAGPDGPAVVELASATQRADILVLTALVYPHHFRPRTPELGRYFGIYLDGRLAAMAGERMGGPGFREISAVCTHSEFAGRGLARRVLTWLGADIARSGRTPFLHVAPTNTRAIALYEQNGYRRRTPIAFAAQRRV